MRVKSCWWRSADKCFGFWILCDGFLHKKRVKSYLWNFKTLAHRDLVFCQQRKHEFTSNLHNIFRFEGLEKLMWSQRWSSEGMLKDANHVYVCLRENYFYENVKMTLGLTNVGYETFMKSTVIALSSNSVWGASSKITFEIKFTSMIIFNALEYRVIKRT